MIFKNITASAILKTDRLFWVLQIHCRGFMKKKREAQELLFF
jgi:hypothetical protein